MMRYKILVNPISGWGLGEESFLSLRLKAFLTTWVSSMTWRATEHPWHAAQLALQAVSDGYDIVVAVSEGAGYCERSAQWPDDGQEILRQDFRDGHVESAEAMTLLLALVSLKI